MKKIVSICIFLVMILITTFVNADNIDISLSTAGDENKKVVKGTELYLYIKMQPADNKLIEEFEADIEYDKSKLSIDSTLTNITGYKDLYSENKIGMKSVSAHGSGTVYTIMFKAATNCEDGDTVININNFNIKLKDDSNNSIETVNVENKNVKLTLITDEEVLKQRDELNQFGKSLDNETKNVENVNNIINDVIKNNNVASKKLPQTGVETISVVAIAGLTVFAIISYVAYKKYKNI